MGGYRPCWPCSVRTYVDSEAPTLYGRLPRCLLAIAASTSNRPHRTTTPAIPNGKRSRPPTRWGGTPVRYPFLARYPIQLPHGVHALYTSLVGSVRFSFRIYVVNWPTARKTVSKPGSKESRNPRRIRGSLIEEGSNAGSKLLLLHCFRGLLLGANRFQSLRGLGGSA